MPWVGQVPHSPPLYYFQTTSHCEVPGVRTLTYLSGEHNLTRNTPHARFLQHYGLAWLFLHQHLKLRSGRTFQENKTQELCKILASRRAQSAWWRLRTYRCHLRSGSLSSEHIRRMLWWPWTLGDHWGEGRGFQKHHKVSSLLGVAQAEPWAHKALLATMTSLPRTAFPEAQSPTLSHSRGPHQGG